VCGGIEEADVKPLRGNGMLELTPELLERYATASSADQRALSNQMTMSQRAELGYLLFDRECMIIQTLIKRTFPSASDAIVRDLLRECVRRLHGDD
jgi:hypothetical protein